MGVVNIVKVKFLDCLISGRMDSPFFNASFVNNNNKVETIPHKPLDKLVRFSSESWNQEDSFEGNFSYIEINAIDIQDGQLQLTKIKHITKAKAPSRAGKIVKNNDILVSLTRPNKGAICLIKNINNICIASTGFAVLRNIQDVLRDYLFIALRFDTSLLQMKQRSSGSIYPAITEKELKKILIPLPPKNIQQQIVDIYNDAIKEKQDKEHESKNLRATIDNYLSKELSIKLPEENEKCFGIKVKILELIGKQLDVKNICFKTHKRKSTKYDEILLSEVVTINKGKSITEDKIISGNYPVIAGGKTSPYSHSESNEKGNVITISASGNAGYVWFHNYEIFASDCYVVRSKDETKYLTEYIYWILELKQDELYQLRGHCTVQSHIYPQDIKRITIPIVDIETQRIIVGHVQLIQKQVTQLNQKAIDSFDAAKQRIEKMALETPYY